MTHWILIADASGARIFTPHGPNHELEMVREIHNPDARKLSQDLVTDGPGRLDKAGAPGTRSATQPRTSPHEAAKEQFAHTLAHTLYKDWEHGAYGTLAIAAPPHFLGMLRPLLNKEVVERLSATEGKDLSAVPVHELRPHIQSLLVPHVEASKSSPAT